MEIDDDFGDLYSDVFLPARPEVSASSPPLAAAVATSTGFSVADSDSEDDLKIVLNDTIGVLDQYVRPGAPVPGGPAGGVASPQGQLRSPLPTGPYPGRRRSDWRSFAPRTIFDFEIDNFEEKPWRHPGADQTDYFNYGFNQESWKDYFKRLESFHNSP